jgi:K+/H+ antiporter YhaU regulatory subunit KhtT
LTVHQPAGSSWTGRHLGALELHRRFGLTALALRDAADAPFRYSPAPEEALRDDAVLVVLGDEVGIGKARADAAVVR